MHQKSCLQPSRLNLMIYTLLVHVLNEQVSLILANRGENTLFQTNKKPPSSERSKYNSETSLSNNFHKRVGVLIKGMLIFSQLLVVTIPF